MYNRQLPEEQFPKIFDLRSHEQNSALLIPSSHFQLQLQNQKPDFLKPESPQKNSKDARTEDQVMNNLTFSIEDLLAKISKVQEEHHESSEKKTDQNSSGQQTQKPVAVEDFKVSNLSSTSTESNTKSYTSSSQANTNYPITYRERQQLKSDRNVERKWTEPIPEAQVHQFEGRFSSARNITVADSLDVSDNRDKQRNKPMAGDSNISPSPGVSEAVKETISPFQNILGLDSVVKNSWKKSIILDDGKSSGTFESLPAETTKLDSLSSLFDATKIREVAASTIMDSPPKSKLRFSPVEKKGINPFDSIVESKVSLNEEESIVESKFENPQYNNGSRDNQQPSQLSPEFKILVNSKQPQRESSQQKQQSAQHFPQKNTSINDFHLGKCLGSGKFGDVYQAIHKQTLALYAIKKIFKSTILQYDMIEQFTRQLKIHYSLNYPNIIKLYTHFDDEYHVFLVMEYAEGGQVMEKLNSGEKFASQVVEQMLRAVEYMQQKKIAHRDIKPQNIVLMFEDTAKLCDFGWARIFDSDMKKTFCGTLDYVSPEMKDKGEYTMNVDMWSVGVLTFEIICGFAPFKNQINNWKQKGSKRNQAWNWELLYPPQVTGLAESFMRNLLKENPNERANIRFCMGHYFIKKYNRMNFDAEEDKRFEEYSTILID